MRGTDKTQIAKNVRRPNSTNKSAKPSLFPPRQGTDFRLRVECIEQRVNGVLVAADLLGRAHVARRGRQCLHLPFQCLLIDLRREAEQQHSENQPPVSDRDRNRSVLPRSSQWYGVAGSTLLGSHTVPCAACVTRDRSLPCRVCWVRVAAVAALGLTDGCKIGVDFSGFIGTRRSPAQADGLSYAHPLVLRGVWNVCTRCGFGGLKGRTDGWLTERQSSVPLWRRNGRTHAACVCCLSRGHAGRGRE